MERRTFLQTSVSLLSLAALTPAWTSVTSRHRNRLRVLADRSCWESERFSTQARALQLDIRGFDASDIDALWLDDLEPSLATARALAVIGYTRPSVLRCLAPMFRDHGCLPVISVEHRPDRSLRIEHIIRGPDLVVAELASLLGEQVDWRGPLHDHLLHAAQDEAFGMPCGESRVASPPIAKPQTHATATWVVAAPARS